MWDDLALGYGGRNVCSQRGNKKLIGNKAVAAFHVCIIKSIMKTFGKYSGEIVIGVKIYMYILNSLFLENYTFSILQS